MRSIGVITTSRADYTYLRPVLRAICADPGLSARLIVSGTHLLQQFGNTVREIEADAFPIAERIPLPMQDDSPAGMVSTMAAAIRLFGESFARYKPDLLVLEGDRFEVLAAGMAALPFGIGIAHLGGGDITEGAMDDAFRHCLTKLSHLHFVAAEPQEQLLLQLGEEPWRVTVSGEPSLDEFLSVPRMTRAELEQQFGLDLSAPFLLVTYHPATLDTMPAEGQADALLAAVDRSRMPAVFTMPNADPGGRVIADRILRFVGQHKACRLVPNFGVRAYSSIMAEAAAMVGNSSSGIVEAASFKLPTVNVGSRQQGRLQAANVIDAACDADEIAEAIQRACSPESRRGLEHLVNPYGDGHAAEAIVHRLRTVTLNDTLLRKRFCTPLESRSAAQ